MLLARLLNQMIKVGRLTVIDANGKCHFFEGEGPGPEAKIRLRDKSLHWRLFHDPLLITGEAYTDGSLTLEGCELYDFIEVVALNMGWGRPKNWVEWYRQKFRRARHLFNRNQSNKAKANVAHHYDLSGKLYKLFLDSDRQYSCGYFQNETDNLEIAQLQKKAHLANKLRLRPGQTVLDIGSGWGGLALYLAHERKVNVTGVTLSKEQYEESIERNNSLGLTHLVRFDLCDYRNIKGTFDRIISVGMFEHVGIEYFRDFFNKMYDMLAEDGIAVLHTIGRADGPGTTNPWVEKYIFPGGYSPALSEIVPFIERAGLYITDIEVLKLHYARTLKEWRSNFSKNFAEIRDLYDEKFCRMWELYLVGSECAFRYGGHVVFQIQMSKRNDLVPDTRNYITCFK